MQTIKVQHVEYPAEDTVSLRLKREGLLAVYLPGQHISVSIRINGETVSRMYSICASPFLDDDIVITVRRVQDGIVSSYLLENAEPGIELDIDGPFGKFNIIPDYRKRHLVMFAGGSGITPLFSMIRTILFKEPQSTVTLVYANRTFGRIIFYKQLNHLKERFYKRFFVYHAVENAETVPSDTSVFFEGRLNRLVVKKLVHKAQKERSYPVEYYLCGPFGYMEMVKNTLETVGVSEGNIYQEHFFVPGEEDNPMYDFENLPQRTIQVDWQNKTHKIKVSAGSSILEAAKEAGLNLPHSCEKAQCGRSFLKSGKVAMKVNHALTEKEIEKGEVLICQGFPVSENVRLEPINNL